LEGRLGDDDNEEEEENHTASQLPPGNEGQTEALLNKEVMHRLWNAVLESNIKKHRPTTSSTTASSSSLSAGDTLILDGTIRGDTVGEKQQVINGKDEDDDEGQEKVSDEELTISTLTTTTAKINKEEEKKNDAVVTSGTNSELSDKHTTHKTTANGGTTASTTHENSKAHDNMDADAATSITATTTDKYANVFERLFHTSNEVTRVREKLVEERMEYFRLRKEEMSRHVYVSKKIPLSQAGSFYQKNIEWLVQREMRLMNEASKGDSKFESNIIPQSRLAVKKD